MSVSFPLTFRHQLDEDQGRASQQHQAAAGRPAVQVLQGQPAKNVPGNFYHSREETADVGVPAERHRVQGQTIITGHETEPGREKHFESRGVNSFMDL